MNVIGRSRTPPSLLGIILGNAFLMSVIYLSLGVVVETIRRLFPHWKWILVFARRMDDLPYTVLLKLGALMPLTTAYMEGRVSEWQLRAIFGATTVAVIFTLAFVTGAALAIVRFFALRRASRG